MHKLFAALLLVIVTALAPSAALAGNKSHLLEGTTGKPSQLAPGRQVGRWMRVEGKGRGVHAENLASRLRFGPEFALMRKPVVDSTYFASN